jgi:hypothetical protein
VALFDFTPSGSALPPYGLSFVGPIAVVCFYTWLYDRTGSVLLCIPASRPPSTT